MTAYEIYARCASAQGDIARIKEKLERRRALATGCTAKPMTQDGGSHGGGDASMRLLDYMADVEQIETELREREKLQEQDRVCCVYIADFLPPVLASIMTHVYLESRPMREVADLIGYSVSHTKRLRREAETLCRKVIITWWDGIHVPVLTMDTNTAGNMIPDEP